MRAIIFWFLALAAATAYGFLWFTHPLPPAIKLAVALPEHTIVRHEFLPDARSKITEENWPDFLANSGNALVYASYAPSTKNPVGIELWREKGRLAYAHSVFRPAIPALAPFDRLVVVTDDWWAVGYDGAAFTLAPRKNYWPIGFAVLAGIIAIGQIVRRLGFRKVALGLLMASAAVFFTLGCPIWGGQPEFLFFALPLALAGFLYAGIAAKSSQ